MADLEAAGAEVLLLSADAGVPGQLRGALRQAREHFGVLDGVVHAAGLPGGGMAERRTAAEAGRVLAPKVAALGPLAELIGPDTPAAERPRLLVLYSSIASVLGGLSESDYCAANTVLDACGAALAAVADRTQVLTVAWGVWQHDDWPGQLTGRPLAERAAYRERHGFADDGGCALLDRLVASADGGLSGAVVALRQALPDAIRDWAVINNLADLLDETAGQHGPARFPRPPLRTGFVPPRTGLETVDRRRVGRVPRHRPGRRRRPVLRPRRQLPGRHGHGSGHRAAAGPAHRPRRAVPAPDGRGLRGRARPGQPPRRPGRPGRSRRRLGPGRAAPPGGRYIRDRHSAARTP